MRRLERCFQRAHPSFQRVWEFASLRNFLYYAGGYLLVVWGVGAWYWGDKEAALATVCRTVAHVPVFCM